MNMCSCHQTKCCRFLRWHRDLTDSCPRIHSQALSTLLRIHTCTCQRAEVYRCHGWRRGCWGNTWSSGEFGNVGQRSQEGRSRWRCRAQAHPLTWTRSSSLRSGSIQAGRGPYVDSTRPGTLEHTCSIRCGCSMSHTSHC